MPPVAPSVHCACQPGTLSLHRDEVQIGLALQAIIMSTEKWDDLKCLSAFIRAHVIGQLSPWDCFFLLLLFFNKPKLH